jgi:hypothetical protein
MVIQTSKAPCTEYSSPSKQCSLLPCSNPRRNSSQCSDGLQNDSFKMNLRFHLRSKWFKQYSTRKLLSLRFVEMELMVPLCQASILKFVVNSFPLLQFFIISTQLKGSLLHNFILQKRVQVTFHFVKTYVIKAKESVGRTNNSKLIQLSSLGP